MYTTNAVESINSSFKKVTKKGAFPNENALLKLLYLRITELYKKWNGSKVQNWAMVRNQLATNDKIKARIEKYEHLIWRRFDRLFRFATLHSKGGQEHHLSDFLKNLHTFIDKAA